MALATYCFLNAWLHYNSTVAGITHSELLSGSAQTRQLHSRCPTYGNRLGNDDARNHKWTANEKWCQKLLLSNSWLEKRLQRHNAS